MKKIGRIVARGLFLLLAAFAALVAAEMLANRPYRENRQVAAPAVRPDRLKIVSFNLGLLDVRLFGRSFLKPTDYLEERFAYMADALLALNADVIALEEIYATDHANRLIARLKAVYPYHFRHSSSLIRLENGLMILSRYPIAEARLEPVVSGPWDETLFASKSILSARILVGPDMPVAFVVVHPTSGGLYGAQDGPDIMAHRGRQIAQAYGIAAAYDTAYNVILGDFNAGPEIAAANYGYLPAQAYVDAYAAHAARSGFDPETTWDAGNILNVHGTHADSVSQRIDHIFLSPALAGATETGAAAVVFQAPTVPLTDEQTVPLSDHYGIMAELVFRERRGQPAPDGRP